LPLHFSEPFLTILTQVAPYSDNRISSRLEDR
jgi:hypothetical protein